MAITATLASGETVYAVQPDEWVETIARYQRDARNGNVWDMEPFPAGHEVFDAAVITEIEAGYVAQGYELPFGWTWHNVHSNRAHWGCRSIDVPLATAGGAVAWGVPFVNGKAMAH